jgi:hypothetical protein
MFRVSPAGLQTFIDTPNRVLKDRVPYSKVHIPNVFCDGHLHLINCVGIVCQVHRDFLITLYNYMFELNANKYFQNLFLKFYHDPHLYFCLSQTFAKRNLLRKHTTALENVRKLNYAQITVTTNC